jgi:hypothetical protein
MRLISIFYVTLEDRVLGQARKREASVAGSLEIFGPLSKIDKVQVSDDWSLFTRQSSSPIAALFPDVSQDEDDLTVSTDLWCLPCLALTTLDKKLWNRVSSHDIQGIMTRRVGGRQAKFRRVGFFTTKQMKGSLLQKKLLKEAPCKAIRLI